jgi:hypothetical protein
MCFDITQRLDGGLPRVGDRRHAAAAAMSTDLRDVSVSLGAAIDECLVTGVDPRDDTSTCVLVARLHAMFDAPRGYLAYLTAARDIDTALDNGHHRAEERKGNDRLCWLRQNENEKRDARPSPTRSASSSVASGSPQRSGTSTHDVAATLGYENSSTNHQVKVPRGA